MQGMKYSIYITETGLIHSQGSSSHVSDLSDILLEDGEGIVEGHYDRATQKIVDGVVTEYVADFFPLIRNKRNELLKESDWTQAIDSPLPDIKKEEWATYRQELRDLTTTYSNAVAIEEIVFPTKPL
tara:strand:+ start:216 stop:596 length:381 start_codon:yes stop_codon:yes gene_type:complete